MSDLPEFRARPRQQVESFARVVFNNEPGRNTTHLFQLIDYPDGHYRAIFKPSYFILPEGQTVPSKSQWSSLKKKMKRHDHQVFVFKAYGEVPCGQERCYYLDFGFFAH
jgi:hypothetical protein